MQHIDPKTTLIVVNVISNNEKDKKDFISLLEKILNAESFEDLNKLHYKFKVEEKHINLKFEESDFTQKPIRADITLGLFSMYYSAFLPEIERYLRCYQHQYEFSVIGMANDDEGQPVILERHLEHFKLEFPKSNLFILTPTNHNELQKLFNKILLEAIKKTRDVTPLSNHRDTTFSKKTRKIKREEDKIKRLFTNH